MTTKRLLSILCCLALASAPVRADFGGGGQLQGFWAADNVVRLTAGSVCVEQATDGGAAGSERSVAVSTGASDGAKVTVVVGIIAEDGATAYTLNSATIDGAATNVVDDNLGARQASASMIATTVPIAGAATVTVSPTFSENITGYIACAWALENLESSTATAAADADAGVGGTATAIVTSSKRGGYLLAVCGTGATAANLTQTIVTARTELDGAELTGRSGDVATDGASMSPTCSSSTGAMTTVAASFR
jgi:hypothetical protein